MPHKSTMLDRQRTMFRIACDPVKHNLTIKIIAADSGIGEQSLRKYAAGETEMPMSAFDALIGVVPDTLLSLLLRDGRQVVCVPDGIDHDDMEAACRDYLADKGRTHHPDSPGGREISDCEQDRLNVKAAVVRAVVA